MTLGERIRSFRENLGWSTHELADKTGVAQSTISTWELDQITPRGRNLIKVAKALGVKVAALKNETLQGSIGSLIVVSLSDDADIHSVCKAILMIRGVTSAAQREPIVSNTLKTVRRN